MKNNIFFAAFLVVFVSTACDAAGPLDLASILASLNLQPGASQPAGGTSVSAQVQATANPILNIVAILAVVADLGKTANIFVQFLAHLQESLGKKVDEVRPALLLSLDKLLQQVTSLKSSLGSTSGTFPQLVAPLVTNLEALIAVINQVTIKVKELPATATFDKLVELLKPLIDQLNSNVVNIRTTLCNKILFGNGGLIPVVMQLVSGLIKTVNGLLAQVGKLGDVSKLLTAAGAAPGKGDAGGGLLGGALGGLLGGGSDAKGGGLLGGLLSKLLGGLLGSLGK